MSIAVPILFVGGAAPLEFAPIASWLALRNAQFSNNVSAAIARIERGFTPTIIVVVQPWTGHVSAAQIEALRQAAPLARIVSLLGTWLEGEARTGKPWPAVSRTYWHQWLPKFAAEIDRLAAGENAVWENTVWSFPSTATDEERLLPVIFMEKATKHAVSPTKTIAIISANRETAESLIDLCRDQGWTAHWFKSCSECQPATIDLALFDSRNLHENEIAQISTFKSENSNLKSEIPLILLGGFPRIADVQQLKSIGVAAVVSKPFLNHELAWQIDELLKKSAPAA